MALGGIFKIELGHPGGERGAHVVDEGQELVVPNDFDQWTANERRFTEGLARRGAGDLDGPAGVDDKQGVGNAPQDHVEPFLLFLALRYHLL